MPLRWMGQLESEQRVLVNTLDPTSLFVHQNSLLVNNCDFQQDGNQVNLGSSVTLARAVITGNVIQVSTSWNALPHAV